MTTLIPREQVKHAQKILDLDASFFYELFLELFKTLDVNQCKDRFFLFIFCLFLCLFSLYPSVIQKMLKRWLCGGGSQS